MLSGHRNLRSSLASVCSACAPRRRRFWAGGDPHAAERTEALLLPALLTDAEIEALLAHAASFGRRRSSGHGALGEELREVPHDVCFSGSHVALYLHRGGQLRAALPGLHAKLLRAMRAQPGDWGDPSSPLRVRCIELHSYSRGGGLLEAAHRDNGSVLTLSVLLSAPGREHAGGEFVTYAEGAPVLHAAQGRGDALLFHSERLHNVCTVTRGVRRALVVELWAQAENGSDRFK